MSDAEGQRRVLSKVLKEIHEEKGGHRRKDTSIETLEDHCPKCPDKIDNPDKYYRNEDV